MVVEFESMWSFAFFVSNGEENAEALNVSSLTVLMIVPVVIILAVGTIVATLAEAPLPPVPSFTNETESPTA